MKFIAIILFAAFLLAGCGSAPNKPATAPSALPDPKPQVNSVPEKKAEEDKKSSKTSNDEGWSPSTTPGITLKRDRK